MLGDANNVKNEKAGSAKHEPAFVLVGKLQRPHGVYGEIAMRVDTDFPERIRRGRTLYLGEDFFPVKVLRTRWKGKLLLLKLDGYNSPEDAADLTNLLAFVSVDDIPPLPEGEYYHHQLIGLNVYAGEEFLGVLTSVLQTGANDVYIVEDAAGKELLLPSIPDVILGIDLTSKRMDVHLMEGLR